MAQAELVVRNPSGLHARPAATFVKAASGYSVDVQVTNLTRDPGRSASARSVLGVLSLGISSGHRIRLDADGDGAEAAISGLSALVESGLGEPVEGA